MASLADVNSDLRRARANRSSARANVIRLEAELDKIRQAKIELQGLISEAYDHGISLGRADCKRTRQWRGPVRDEGVAKYGRSQNYVFDYYWGLEILMYDLLGAESVCNNRLQEAMWAVSNLDSTVSYLERERTRLTN